MAVSKKVKVVGGVGAGLAAIVAGAAAAYFLYGKNGAKNRKKVKGWMLQAKGEVLEKMESFSDFSEKNYQEVVADVVKRYKALKKLDEQEVALFLKEMKGYWSSIKKHIPKEKPVAKKKK